MTRYLSALALLLSGSAAWGEQLVYSNITASSGIVYDGIGAWGCGVTIGDYNNDGWDDVLMVGSLKQRMQLFRNNGNKTFTNVTAQTIPAGAPRVSGAIFVDLDNDGDQDIAVARFYTAYDDLGFHYFINQGGYFVSGVNKTQIARAEGRLGGITASDVDKDGDIDIAITHYYGPGTFIRNDGIFNFVDATSQVSDNLGDSRRHWGAVFADYNNDGWPDLHSCIDFYADYQIRNNGNGTFSDVSVAANVTNRGADMGLAVGDIDNDLDLDMYTTNIGRHCLYVNEGAGYFVDSAEAHGVARVENDNFAVAWGCTFADFDLDRDVDLAMVTEEGFGSLYENDGAGYFHYATAGTNLLLQGFCLVAFDFDRDGDLDAMTAEHFGPPKIFENTTNLSNHWLKITPVGTISNRSSVNARVYVTAGGVTQMREILPSGSFYGGLPSYAHFGLGDAATADSIEVVWPSGVSLKADNVAADQHLIFNEPTGGSFGEIDDDGERVDAPVKP